MRKIEKKASLLHQGITHIILIGLIFGLFFAAINSKTNSRVVKQQILEKQIALLIDSSVSGMEFYLSKRNLWGRIDSVKINNNRVFISVEGYSISKGYNYFTKNNISIEENKEGFIIKIK